MQTRSRPGAADNEVIMRVSDISPEVHGGVRGRDGPESNFRVRIFSPGCPILGIIAGLLPEKGWFEGMKRLLTSRVLRFALFGGLLGFLISPIPCRAGKPQTPVVKGAKEEGPMSKWKKIDVLVSEQKFQAALESVAGIIEDARANGDSEDWTRALIESTKLEIALHGYDRAVRKLLESPWPEGPSWRMILHLYTAKALESYAASYGWEIRKREKVISSEEVDLKRWTMDQIINAAHANFLDAWKDRNAWGNRGLDLFASYFNQGTYPARIRGSLRDAVAYLWVDLLRNTSYWRPEASNGIFMLDLGAMARGEIKLDDEDLGDGRIHPLMRIAAILDDLEDWHEENSRPEAALEAMMTRIKILDAEVETAEDHALFRKILGHRLAAMDTHYEWWAMGMARLADMTRTEDAPDALVRARNIASEALAGHSSDLGGAACRAVISSIEASAYDMQAMAVDSLDRASIAINYRNLSRLYFRAYLFDLEKQISKGDDYNLLPGYREIPKMVSSRRPDAVWTMELPETPDYRMHRSFSSPELSKKGCYVVVSSTREDFSEEDNKLQAIIFFASDLVLTQEEQGRNWEITARDGRDGHTLSGIELSLFRADWRRGHQLIERFSTGPDGRVLVTLPEEHSRFFLLGASGEDVAFIGNLPRLYHREPSITDRVFLYTDRSVYRPGQTIHFKVVTFSGGGREYSYHTRPDTDLLVSLKDANGEEVGVVALKTNEFGSASGSFEIPSGRMLGSWSLFSSFARVSVSVRVEEYKRPTFEVEISDPEQALRLNRTAKLDGEARYYFGLPVAEGNFKWRVTRETVYPRWWWWPTSVSGPENIAAGQGQTDEDGGFSVSFEPRADERLAEKGVTYRFRLAVDVTEPGGETRSAERVFRLGFAAVEASVSGLEEYLPAGREAEIGIRRTDLDGIGRSGNASWSLVRLEQPEICRMPSEEPLPEPEDPRTFQTEGDRSRPRWDTAVRSGEIMARWNAGREISSGELHHDSSGDAHLVLPELRPGAYRLVYRTVDDFGRPFELKKSFFAGAAKGPRVQLPVFLVPEERIVHFGETARLFIATGFPDQEVLFEVYHAGKRIDRRVLSRLNGGSIIEIPVDRELRGGFSARISLLRDHQLISSSQSIFVPWDDRKLSLSFETFRDRMRPGESQVFRVRVRSSDGRPPAAGSAELLAYMYDRSLDIFADHSPPQVDMLYPGLAGLISLGSTLGVAPIGWIQVNGFGSSTSPPYLRSLSLKTLDGYGIGGPGMRGRQLFFKAGAMPAPMVAAAEMETSDSMVMEDKVVVENLVGEGVAEEAPHEHPEPGPEIEMRSDFAETAFFEPTVTLDREGMAVIEFTAPDSVTEWNLWVHALTTDLRGASEKRTLKTVKDLMVRPAVPRFLREGDRTTLRVTINNAGQEVLDGMLRLKLVDPATGEDLREAFGMDVTAADGSSFSVEPGKGVTLGFDMKVPPRPGMVQFEVSASAGDFTDGERRPLPVLPGRMHLMQSRFAALHDQDSRELVFEDMAIEDDPSRIDEQLIVTVDAQLFYGVLNALPYLIDYPYECTEQTLNRFLSTGIVSSVFEEYPAVARMAEKMASRETRLESWDQDDPNRKIALEETPWLVESRGGRERNDLIKVLDPRVSEAQRRSSLAKLEKIQTSSGAFPWWPGGPPSPYMTLYVLAGFSHALEFGIEVPKDVVIRAWAYTHRHYLDELVRDMQKEDCCWEFITWLNFVLSSYPDESWTGGVFSHDERVRMLDFSFSHWKKHSPFLKSYLALTLHRMGRKDDARLVWESVMDSVIIDRDLGAYWAREDLSWLWYNDTTETQAVALRTLGELDPDDSRQEGLVQWLFLNKKLNHWKSTRTTAEVIYSLVHYLKRKGQLGVREEISVKAGPIGKDFVFEPDAYTGNNARLIIPGPEIRPKEMSRILVSKETPGLAFATASWHFSTEKLPTKGDGDLFSVHRTLYLRKLVDGEWNLMPLDGQTPVGVGDEVEVELRIRARHAAEYVHLRDPRASGFEPESVHSGYRWNLGLPAYEEIRDSGENFFFEWLPAGEYTFRYRIRATMEGKFKLAPAVLQSMYAPEFGAYSAGQILEVSGE